MLVSFPFAWMYLLPSSFIDFSKSILYSLGFSSNFYFDFTATLYQVESSLKIPFLHTWSLSVEEQFYLVFPIIFYFVLKYFNKNIGIILIFGFIISLLAAHWGSQNKPYFTFYALPTRGWELLAGSILAYYEITLGHRSKHQTLNLILPTLGLVLIGHSILFFNDQMFHPSFYTLSPIIGVCLIIWFSHKDELITKILSFKLFVGIGLISYSLYLWHYPIFAFARIKEFVPGSIFNKPLLGAIILILSIVSYYFVERPARNRKYNFKVIFFLIIFSCSALIVFNSNVILKDGYKNRLPEILGKNLSDDKIFDKIFCSNAVPQGIQDCKFNTSSNKKVYIIGDSHMASLLFNLKDKVVNRNYQFITSILGGCIYFPSFNKIEIKTNKIHETCNNKYFTKLKETLSKETDSIIIFGGRFPLYLSNYRFDNQEGGIEGKKWLSKYISTGKYETIQNSFKAEVLKLSQKNKIILIYPIPEVGWDVPKKVYLQWINRKNQVSGNFTLKNINTSYQVYQNRTKSSFELLDTIQSDNVYRVYPHTLFCDTLIEDRCVTHDDKNIFYRDDDHPSLKGSEMINDLVIKEIEKIELTAN